MKIVLCYPAEARHVSQIQSLVPGSEVVAATPQTIHQELLDADIYCGHARTPIDWDMVVHEGRLRWIQSTAAGVDHCLSPSVIDSPIVVTSASGLFADPVAEHTLALLLALLRRIPLFVQRQREHRFDRESTEDLKGKTVLIVGFGGNGRRIAEVLVPFQVRILATDCLSRPKPAWVEQLFPAERLPDLLPQVDVVILCVPLTAATRGMFNEEAFQLCKPGMILINMARGPVIVESALVRALQLGVIGAAGLDVTEQEPLPNSSLLWDLPNVLITPHVGAQSVARLDRTTAFFCENLQRYLRGVPLKNLVNKELGFPDLVW